ncbi:MAG: hypothetical protein IPP82_16795 [Xanthomonadales bacterium]|nr:hypothetical protein [Xanthomonadales bacterium]
MSGSEKPELVVELSVAAVDSGGNTGRGRYFYSFTPDIILVTQSPTKLVFKFSSETESHFSMQDFVTSDSKYQLSEVVKSTDGRSFTMLNQNTQKTLISISVLVKDTKMDVLINCDPQMPNIPVVG